MKKKLLIACPVSQHKDYIINEWLNNINHIINDFSLKDIYDVTFLLVDNSLNSNYHLKLTQSCNLVHYVNPLKTKNTNNKIRNIEYITKSQMYIRNYAIKKHFDVWLSIECDLFPTIKHIDSMLNFLDEQTTLSIIGFPYFIDTGKHSVLMLQEPEPREFGEKSIVKNFTQNQSFLFINGNIRRAFAIGLGCTLIPIEVLKKIKFRYRVDEAVHADCYFYQDCYNAQISVFCDTSDIIIHKNKNWHEVYEKEKRY